MAARVLEMVPNFSEGRDLRVVALIREAIEGAGATVVHWTSDPDHNRSVITAFGSPAEIEAAALAAAAAARDAIDLRGHRGVHPRIGALDVLPFVPLAGVTLEDASRLARRVAARIAAEVGIPAYLYGAASDPPGRGLATLRRGGFETIVAGWPEGREPDALPPGWSHPGAHPTAGAVCVGAREPLLAWNVELAGISLADARRIAAGIREAGGGFRGLRALALELPSRGTVQISMNLEDPRATPPAAVFARIEALAGAAGGRVERTEVIGLAPDELAVSAAAATYHLDEPLGERLLSRRLAMYLAGSPGAAGV